MLDEDEPLGGAGTDGRALIPRLAASPGGRTTNALTLGHPSVLPAILEHRQFGTGSANPV